MCVGRQSGRSRPTDEQNENWKLFSENKKREHTKLIVDQVYSLVRTGWLEIAGIERKVVLIEQASPEIQIFMDFQKYDSTNFLFDRREREGRNLVGNASILNSKLAA